VTFIILLAVLGGFAYRVTTPEERERFLTIAKSVVRRLRVATTEPGPEYESFRAALRARTSLALVTPAIVLISGTIVVGMLFGARAISDPDTLVAWGASLGTRTTNGEWWRLVTSTFVHTGTLHLVVDVLVLIQVGGILERLVGRLTFIAVYLSAGVFAGLVNLSSHPVAVTVGTSAAIFGLYGLLLASLFWQIFQRRRGNPEPDAEERGNAEPDAEESTAPSVAIPLIAMKRLGVGAAVFIVYSALGGLAHGAEFTGLFVGLMYGLVLARSVSEREPGTRQVAFAMVATGVIAVGCAIALRSIADVKPEIARVLATEERTAAGYQVGFDAFKRGRMTPEALAQLAEHVMPELQAADARLKALNNVPPEDQPLVADAREYLRLRGLSWRARADAIRKTSAGPRGAPAGGPDASSRLQAEARFRSDMTAMGSAERAERASLEAFERIKRATGRRL
jgi:membrane associated rhomboid family serine protease